MSFRDKMKKQKSKLAARHKKAVQDTGGGRYPTIFNKDAIPDGVEFYKVGEGEHMLDIIPFEAGPDMPLDKNGNPMSEEGDFDYVLDLWVHSNIGKMKKPYVCQYENFGEACPICEYLKSERRDKPIWDLLHPRRRVLYLVWARNDRKSEAKGIQLLEASHYFMENNIAEIAKLPRGGGSILFSDPDNGKTLCFTRQGVKMDNTKFLGHKFIDREDVIPDEILEQTFPLDSIVTMHPKEEEVGKEFYETMKMLGMEEEVSKLAPYDGTGDDVPEFEVPDDQEETPRKKRPVKKRPVKKPSGGTAVKKRPVKKRPVKRRK